MEKNDFLSNFRYMPKVLIIPIGTFVPLGVKGLDILDFRLGLGFFSWDTKKPRLLGFGFYWCLSIGRSGKIGSA